MDIAALAALLTQREMTVSTAESCSGGLLAKTLTDVPGSSAFFIEGVVAYADAAKTRLLGVTQASLQQHGAVSEEVAAAMARGCRERSGTDYAISVTGIAGPGGGSAAKSVGLVYVGIADADGCRVQRMNAPPGATRSRIRNQAVALALDLLAQAAGSTTGGRA